MNQKKRPASAASWFICICKVLLLVWLFFLVGAIGWFFGMLHENNKLTGINYAAYALKSTGLPSEYAPGFSLHGYTGFRDSYMQTEFCIDFPSDRQTILKLIQNTDHWYTAPVTASEYSDFAGNVMWQYENSWRCSDEIVFDAWFYRETSEPHAPNNRVPEGPMEQIGPYAGRGFEYALFDVDTGLFIYIDQFG